MASTTRDRHRPLLILLGSLAASATLLYVVLFGPKIQAIEQLKADAKARQAQVSEALRAYGEMAERKGEKTLQWDEVFARFDKRVPVGPQQERFMAELGDLAVRRQLGEFRLSGADSAGNEPTRGTVQAPGQPLDSALLRGATLGAAGGPSGEADAVARESFVETRYRVLFTSAYRDLADFLDDLPRLSRLVAVRSVKVREKEGRMETALEISIFHRRTP